MACLQAVALINKLGIQPRRTHDSSGFWVNEENGGRGGVAYREFVGDKLKNQVAAIEMDGGAEAPRGFRRGRGPRSTAMLKQVRQTAGARRRGRHFAPGGGGEDIPPLLRDGVPGLSRTHRGHHYFDWHHTEADTLDKVSPEDFRKNVAALAVMSYALADMPQRLTAAAGGRRGRQGPVNADIMN